jgi:ribonucleoside-diphosphate reductase alpha chain
MAMAPEHTGIGIRRRFTTAGVHPYDMVTWERRDARITNYRDGTVAFEQLDVEVPTSWSLNATNILAQKYFRGTLGTSEREHSLRQVAGWSTRSRPGASATATSRTMRRPRRSATSSST